MPIGAVIPINTLVTKRGQTLLAQYPTKNDSNHPDNPASASIILAILMLCLWP